MANSSDVVVTHQVAPAQSRPRTGMSRLKLRREVVGWLFIMPWFLGFLIFSLGPFLASLWLSFTSWELIGPANWVGTRNYTTLFTQDLRFTKTLFNSLYYTVFYVPLTLVLAFFIAILLNEQVKGRAFFRTAFYLPSVSSGVGTMLLWVWLLNNDGLLNYFLGRVGINGPNWLGSTQWAMPALIMMSLWGLGGTMIIYLAGLQAIPQYLYEAVAIDGGGAWAKLWHVTIPQMTPSIFFTLIIGIIDSLQVFSAAYVMTEGGPADSTLFYLLYLYYQAFRYFRMGYASAMAWMLFLLILVLTLVQLRLARRWVYYEGQESH
jgi:multiple sugar transport system permease protein